MPPLAAKLPLRRESTTVRLLRETDLDAFHSYRSDRNLARFQGWTAMSREAAHAFLVEMARVAALIPGDWIQLAIAEAEADVLIGDLGLFLDADLTKGEIGFTLSSGAQGSGHATRATQAAIELIFASSPASEVRAVTDARNESSVRVLERVGFHQAGEQQAIFKGESCTELVYVYRRSDAKPSATKTTIGLHSYWPPSRQMVEDVKVSPDSKPYPESLCLDAGGILKAVDPLAVAVVHAAQAELRECLRMVRHCVNQLSQSQIWSRPDEHHNAIGNLLLHLEGNLRQWIVAGLGNSVDLRNRPAEFAERRPLSAIELLTRLDGCVHDAIVALSNTDTPTGLLKPRRIQGFEVHCVAAIQHSVSHFRGHTQEIIGRTRQLLGRNYRFAWIPKDAEQGS
ncbi:MAG: GNAT family N-acetyltransferase [Planctomycetota bacterium]